MTTQEILSMDDWSIGWYCVRSKPRMENVAAATLSSLERVEVFLPRTQRQNLKIKAVRGSRCRAPGLASTFVGPGSSRHEASGWAEPARGLMRDPTKCRVRRRGSLPAPLCGRRRCTRAGSGARRERQTCPLPSAAR